MLEKTPESPLDSKEIKPLNLKGDQPWIFTESTDAEAEAPVFWSCDVNRWLTLMAESKEELKGLLIKVKEESEKAGLKLSIQKTKIMASGPITSWQMNGKWKQWETLFSWTPKSLQMVTAAMKLKDTCSLEEKLLQT